MILKNREYKTQRVNNSWVVPFRRILQINSARGRPALDDQLFASYKSFTLFCTNQIPNIERRRKIFRHKARFLYSSKISPS